MKTIIAAIFACLSAISFQPAHALPVTVDNVTYDITTITGTFEDNAELLMDQAWWNDATLAGDIALELGAGLGLPNFIDTRGPFFAAMLIENDTRLSSRAFQGGLFPLATINQFLNQSSTFAIVTPSAVPLPASLLLMLTAVAGLGLMRRRKVA